MLPDSEIGKSGIDEAQVEPTIEQAYLDTAAKRGMFPPSAVRSMLDPSQSLVQLNLEGGGVEFITLPELESKPLEQGAWRERQLVPANQMASFNGQELRQRRWISSLVNQRELLPVALKLTGPIQERPLFTLPRKPVYLKLSGVLHRRVVNRTLRAIDDAVNNQKADLVLIQLDSPGGNLDDSIRLAYRLADIPSDKAEVIVYVSKHARGDAALIALAADAIYMAPDAVLGTGGEASIDAAAIEKRKDNFLELAQRKSRAAGDLVGLVHPDAIVHDFLAADGRRMRTVPTWVIDDPQNPLWTKGQAVDYSKGIDTDRAIAEGLASDRAEDLDRVAKIFGIYLQRGQHRRSDPGKTRRRGYPDRRNGLGQSQTTQLHPDVGGKRLGGYSEADVLVLGDHATPSRPARQPRIFGRRCDQVGEIDRGTHGRRQGGLCHGNGVAQPNPQSDLRQ
jgi:ATP-dependent protease ClpP protease subunit